jgi:hypothetical protein
MKFEHVDRLHTALVGPGFDYLRVYSGLDSLRGFASSLGALNIDPGMHLRPGSDYLDLLEAKLPDKDDVGSRRDGIVRAELDLDEYGVVCSGLVIALNEASAARRHLGDWYGQTRAVYDRNVRAYARLLQELTPGIRQPGSSAN